MMQSFATAATLRRPDHLVEDERVAATRAAQLAKLAPLAAHGREPELLELAQELCADLARALKNLRSQ